MSVGRSTGLIYDNWVSQNPTWDVDDIRHEPPLLRHEAIVCAMEERFLARSFTTPEGQPPDIGLNFRDIASQGYLMQDTLFDLVRDVNVDLLNAWVNYNDNGGIWHGLQNCAPSWDESLLALDIDPLGSGVLQELQHGDLYTAEYIREQYDIINRKLWYLEPLSNRLQLLDEPTTNNGALGVALLEWSFNIGGQTVNKEAHEGHIWGGGGGLAGINNDILGEFVQSYLLNTLSAAPDNAISIGPDNDVGNYYLGRRDGIYFGRAVLDFGFVKEYDTYIFPTQIALFHNAATTDDFDSPLNGTFNTLATFVDHSGIGVLNSLWTYASDSFDVKIGPPTGSDGSTPGGWQVRIPQGGSLSDIVHDPITEDGIIGSTLNSYPSICVVRLDLPGGLKFVDPLINPSASHITPPVLFSSPGEP